MFLAQLVRGAHAFVDAGRRHADVGEDDVGPLGVDGGDELVVVAARADDLDALLRLQEPDDPLAHEVAVLRDHHPGRHRPRGYGDGPRRPRYVGPTALAATRGQVDHVFLPGD